MTDRGPVGVYGGAGYPAPLRGVNTSPPVTPPRLAHATSNITDNRVLVLGNGAWILPPRCQIRFDARAGLAHVRSGDELWTIADDGSSIDHTDEERRMLLEAWSLL